MKRSSRIRRRSKIVDRRVARREHRRARHRAARARGVDNACTRVVAPRFEVDPLWPKPLPNHWVLGNVIGVGVDAKDHVFIVHRNDTFNAQQEIGAVQNRRR